MKPKTNFWIIVLLIVLLSIFQSYLKDSTVERTIYFLILLIVISYFIAVNSTKKINLKRSTRETRQQVGQYFKENYEIENIKTQPVLWILLEDESNITLKKGKWLIAWLSGNSIRNFINQSVLDKRGVFTLGPTKLSTGDPFGIFQNKMSFESLEKLVVIPTYEKLNYFPEPSGYLTGGKARKTRNTEVSPYSISVRDYSPGDPLRRIDWKSTARLEKIMVKEFEEDPQANVWIMLDANIEGHHFLENKKKEVADQPLWERRNYREFELPPDTLEYGISFAASICDYYLNNLRSVGFSSNGQKIINIPPESSTRQLDKILEILASINISENVRFPEYLLSQKQVIQKGSSIILITSSLNMDLVYAIEQIKKRNISIVLVCIDPESFGGAENSSSFYDTTQNMGIQVLKVEREQRINEIISNIAQIF